MLATARSAGTFEVVTLTVFAADADFLGTFDRIEVWRSRSLESGPYEELTGDLWRGARIPSTGGSSAPVSGPEANIVGLVLELVLNEKDTVPTLFSGTNPLTLAQAALQIEAQSVGRLRSWVDSEGELVIETTEPGTAATLRVVPSSAASFLGLPTTAYESGKEARIQLAAGVGTYTFSDKAGSSSFFYKTRYRNQLNSNVSEFGPVYKPSTAGVDPTSVVRGYLDLVGSDGKALAGIEVSLRSPFVGQLVAGKLVAGQDLMKKTDADGHVEFTLMRGQTYTLAISGTNIAKELMAPLDAAITSFLLVDDRFATQDDYFRARTPQIPTMVRRSF